MIAHDQLYPPIFHATRLQRARRRKLVRHAGNPFAGPVLPAGPPVKTTPTSIASGPAQAPSQARLGNRKRMKVAKPSSRPISPFPSRREPMSARAGPFA